ncbi:MAG: oligosaccharide flippase family protein [Bacteroidales bacterium]|nr:oligosaccharide flippase family protein [Bacteroidales bacterium]
MAGIKSLAKDTAIYGISSIVGRFLNWMLVPLYTHVFDASEYGVVTFVYSVVALALVILTYGMETGFFRFANHERWKDPMEVYSTCLASLAVSSVAFVALVAVFIKPITLWMQCAGHPSFVIIMAACVAIDAYLSLPYSYLRYARRPMRFAMLRLTNIGLNIGLNLFFILLCPWLMKVAPASVSWFYDPAYGVGYIFLANFIASLVNLLMMLPDMTGFRWKFNATLWREILRYSAPLLVLGVAGIMNQTLGNLLYPHLVADKAEAMYGLGIYGANYKVAVVLLVFLQAFRFAYEPFIFSRSREKGEAKFQSYRDAMKYFVAFALLIFLAVMFYLDYIKYFISPAYFAGLVIVPIVMLGELFYGIFYNLAVWYKLTDRTVWGMWFSLGGLVVTVVLNIVLVPRISYMGCAVASLACYATMMLASYFVGNRLYPIGYPTGRICGYFGIAAAIYVLGFYLLPMAHLGQLVNAIVRFGLLCLFCWIFCRIEGITVASLLTPVRKFVRR